MPAVTAVKNSHQNRGHKTLNVVTPPQNTSQRPMSSNAIKRVPRVARTPITSAANSMLAGASSATALSPAVQYLSTASSATAFTAVSESFGNSKMTRSNKYLTFDGTSENGSESDSSNSIAESVRTGRTAFTWSENQGGGANFVIGAGTIGSRKGPVSGGVHSTQQPVVFETRHNKSNKKKKKSRSLGTSIRSSHQSIYLASPAAQCSELELDNIPLASYLPKALSDYGGSINQRSESQSMKIVAKKDSGKFLKDDDDDIPLQELRKMKSLPSMGSARILSGHTSLHKEAVSARNSLHSDTHFGSTRYGSFQTPHHPSQLSTNTVLPPHFAVASLPIVNVQGFTSVSATMASAANLQPPASNSMLSLAMRSNSTGGYPTMTNARKPTATIGGTQLKSLEGFVPPMPPLPPEYLSFNATSTLGSRATSRASAAGSLGSKTKTPKKHRKKKEKDGGGTNSPQESALTPKKGHDVRKREGKVNGGSGSGSDRKGGGTAAAVAA
ncbi:hypothetical protein HDU83_003011 [Entophlyctis luteolus]|nr:hypothetical protein HDU83_003011 [Entophlyctis luteolus]